MTWITHADPLSYGVDGLRGILIGSRQFSFATDLAILVGLAAALLG